MLTAAEITAMQSTVNSALPDSATISRVTLTTTSLGGSSEGWATVATVACRVSPLVVSSAVERAAADVEMAVSPWVITLPANTDIRITDRVVVGARTFEVVSLQVRRSWELHTGVHAQEVL